ncbi:cytochrome c [uncultured Winogradskyella sp.]|uniref:c-type cytochrome n=1 Tax=uncultured Winogradskyella sp. TaxID=395353 RepID=UPI0026181906|nr:cytochrome c [uncultured Winogradskyella sp.]
MKKVLFALLLVFCLSSCGSDKKEEKAVRYPEKTSLKQTAPELKESINRGELVYNDLCITCHMANGKGAPKAFPPLAGSDYLKENQVASIKGIKNGMSGEIIVNGETYNSVMAPSGLSDEEIADVMNYINNSWGNNYGKMITSQEVTKVIKK